jgi:streptogramin lyase
MSPYEASVDSRHRLWVSLQGADEVARLDPDTEKWTFYSWASRGTAQRQNNILDRNGVLQVVLTSSANHRVGRMVMRTAEEIQALRVRAN